MLTAEFQHFIMPESLQQFCSAAKAIESKKPSGKVLLTVGQQKFDHGIWRHEIPFQFVLKCWCQPTPAAGQNVFCPVLFYNNRRKNFFCRSESPGSESATRVLVGKRRFYSGVPHLDTLLKTPIISVWQVKLRNPNLN